MVWTYFITIFPDLFYKHLHSYILLDRHYFKLFISLICFFIFIIIQAKQIKMMNCIRRYMYMLITMNKSYINKLYNNIEYKQYSNSLYSQSCQWRKSALELLEWGWKNMMLKRLMLTWFHVQQNASHYALSLHSYYSYLKLSLVLFIFKIYMKKVLTTG